MIRSITQKKSEEEIDRVEDQDYCGGPHPNELSDRRAGPLPGSP